MEVKVETSNTSVEINANNTSIENMMGNPNDMSKTLNVSKTNWWSMKDFNNVIEADRKLIVNSKIEFWVHDEVLSTYSDYFAELFNKPRVHFGNEEVRTEINNIPHDKKMFDILVWMYSKDSKKLKKAAKSFHDFLHLISLGIFLKLKPDFFEILLAKPSFQWKEEYFYDTLWSRKVFTFPVLERVVDEMKTNNFTKTVGKYNIITYIKYF